MEELHKRLDELEKRVARLEGQPPTHDQGRDTTPSPLPIPTSIIRVRITNKKHQPQDFEIGEMRDHCWFDCEYLLDKASKPTRAVKGVMEFADLFGDVKFCLEMTINDRLEPARSFKQVGIGFGYNEYIASHNWICSTKETDMKVEFRVTDIIY